MHGGGRDIRRPRRSGGSGRSLGGRLLGWLGAVGLGLSAAISPRTSIADTGDDRGDRAAGGKREIGTEIDDGWSGGEGSHPGLAPARPGLVGADRDGDGRRSLDPSGSGAWRRERGAVEETRAAALPSASDRDPANESFALGPVGAPAWVGWSGASALVDPEETGDDQATSFPDESVGVVGWPDREAPLRRMHPRSRAGDVRVQTPHVAAARPDAAPDAAPGQPSPPAADGCAPAFLDRVPGRGDATGASVILPATLTPTATPGDSPPRRWLSRAIGGLGPSAPSVSLGSRTLLPRISFLVEAGHGPAGTNLAAYITASFTLDRGPLVTSAGTTFARIAARHEQAAAKQTAAFVRLLGQIAAARCVSAAEQEALVGSWRDAP
jgi:hypothetical protein